jgi:alanyl-tRNA synthetase
MTSKEIRQSFLKFFEERGHTIVQSAPVIPHGDKTLLFTNAGMNQFKDVFLGEGSRSYTRAADTQKVIRVSGKHNDLEEVGHDTYHHTFFEMLGNWSFGDYYKKEAVSWAWELLTKVWKLDKSRLYATVFESDDESAELWKDVTDIDPSHIIRCGAKDNFWEMGDTGPCGPCSEIHFDNTTDKSGGPLVNVGDPRVIEIWNLVFIQYNRTADGTLEELPMKHVDTGMGFERACAVMQGKPSNYDTDVFTPYISWLAKKSDHPYGADERHDIAMRVIADHVRTLTSAIADGALPGKEGRGYVLRRILRRAVRYGRNLGFQEPFLCDLSAVAAEQMGHVFPEMRDRLDLVQKVIRAEEESFLVTLDRGLALFDEMAAAVEDSESPLISGEEAFKLYDTFGFPIDLTQVIARERGLSVDMQRFEELLQEQKDRSLRVHASKKQVISAVTELSNVESLFTGYDAFEDNGRPLVIEGNTVILNRTPFYAESGGQVSDTGVLMIEGNPHRVKDVRKTGAAIAHILEEESIEASPDVTVHASIDKPRRFDIMRNHSATHLMHSALRKVLGEHVHQSGSLVNEDRLRFDFSHFQKVTPEEIRDIEALVNEKIRESIRLVHHRNIPFDEAKKMGALMFFGDKYGARVNVVDFGPFSREFCGGTHVANSAEIGLFKFVSESSIASGVRRVEAVTGRGIERWLSEQEAKYSELSRERDTLEAEKQKLEKELAKFRLESRREEMRQLAASSKNVSGSPVSLITREVTVRDADEFKSLGEMLREELSSGTVAVLGARLAEDKVSLIGMVTDDLIKAKKIEAGKLIGRVAEIVGGRGGGRPQFAQAGGRDPHKLGEALTQAEKIVAEIVT